MIKKPNNNCKLCKCLHNYSYFKKGEYYWAELGERFFAGAVVVYFGKDRHNMCSVVFSKSVDSTFLLSVIFVFLVPTKETAYKMIIANYVTPNNISTVKEVTEDNIASLIDKIAVTSQALSGREKKEKSK